MSLILWKHPPFKILAKRGRGVYMEKKPLHEMTEEELRAEVKTWDLNPFLLYVEDPELDFEDDA